MKALKGMILGLGEIIIGGLWAIVMVVGVLIAIGLAFKILAWLF